VKICVGCEKEKKKKRKNTRIGETVQRACFSASRKSDYHFHPFALPKPRSSARMRSRCAKLQRFECSPPRRVGSSAGPRRTAASRALRVRRRTAVQTAAVVWQNGFRQTATVAIIVVDASPTYPIGTRFARRSENSVRFSLVTPVQFSRRILRGVAVCTFSDRRSRLAVERPLLKAQDLCQARTRAHPECATTMVYVALLEFLL